MILKVEVPGRTYTLTLCELEEQSQFWEDWYALNLSGNGLAAEELPLDKVRETVRKRLAVAWSLVRDVSGLPEGVDKAVWLAKPPVPIQLAILNRLPEVMSAAIKVHLSDVEGND